MVSNGNYIISMIELISGDNVQSDKITKMRGYFLLVVEWNGVG